MGRTMKPATVSFVSCATLAIICSSAQGASRLYAGQSLDAIAAWDSPYPYSTFQQIAPTGASDGLSLPLQSLSANNSGSDWAAASSASASASAGLGHLHTYASAGSSTNNLDYAGYGSAEGDANFQDDFTILASPGHPAGSKVRLNARLVVDSQTTIIGYAQAHLHASLRLTNTFGSQILNLQYLSDSTTPPPPPQPHVQLDGFSGEFWVGSTYTLGGYMTNWVTASTQDGATLFSSITCDASNTSHSYLWPEDPTVVISTATGATYTVPEPATALLLVGPMLLIRRLRQK